MINHDLHRNKVKIPHFFNKTKIIQIDIIPEINLLITRLIIIQQMMKNTIIKIINDVIQAKDLVLTVLTNQIFSNRDEQTRQPKNNPTSYNNNFQQLKPVNTQSYKPTQKHNEIPLPYYLQQHEITKVNLQIVLKSHIPQNHYK